VVAMPWWGRGRGGWGKGRGGWAGPWPGRGPFADLPPWERPGWRLGPGACWRIYGAPGWLAWPRGPEPWTRGSGQQPPASPEEAELRLLEDYRRRLEEELRSLEQRIEELRRRTRSQ